MSRQKEREEFVSIMAQDGVTLHVARLLMRAGATLQRLAELECSSEAADRDRVPCPVEHANHAKDCIRRTSPAAECSCFKANGPCLCRDYGSYNDETGEHGDIPRIARQGDQVQARVSKLCEPLKLVPIFNGDPRGAVLKIKVPSGRTNDMGRDGVCVP